MTSSCRSRTIRRRSRSDAAAAWRSSRRRVDWSPWMRRARRIAGELGELERHQRHDAHRQEAQQEVALLRVHDGGREVRLEDEPVAGVGDERCVDLHGMTEILAVLVDGRVGVFEAGDGAAVGRQDVDPLVVREALTDQPARVGEQHLTRPGPHRDPDDRAARDAAVQDAVEQGDRVRVAGEQPLVDQRGDHVLGHAGRRLLEPLEGVGLHEVLQRQGGRGGDDGERRQTGEQEARDRPPDLGALRLALLLVRVAAIGVVARPQARRGQVSHGSAASAARGARRRPRPAAGSGRRA